MLLVMCVNGCLSGLNIAQAGDLPTFALDELIGQLHPIENISPFSHSGFTKEKPRELAVHNKTNHTNLGLDFALGYSENV